MARKLDNGPELRQQSNRAALRILDWDEGTPYGNGWFGVNITYREERLGFEADCGRSFLRVEIDPSDPNHKSGQ